MLDDFRGKLITDAQPKITEFLVSELKKVPKDKEINWDKLKKYCIEFGFTKVPNRLTVPIPVIEHCIIKAKIEINNDKLPKRS